MSSICNFLVLFLAFAFANAGPTSSNSLVLHEARDTIPSGFVLSEAASANTTLRLRVALTQKDISGLEKALYDVSTPGTASYGKHLSKEEVRHLAK